MFYLYNIWAIHFYTNIKFKKLLNSINISNIKSMYKKNIYLFKIIYIVIVFK